MSKALLVASETMIHCTRTAQSCTNTLSLVSSAQKASLEDGEENHLPLHKQLQTWRLPGVEVAV